MPEHEVQAPETIRAYLAVVEARLRTRLAPSEVEATLQETESHLRESASEIETLGYTPYDAEREAIRAFGAEDSYADRMAEVQLRRPRPDRWITSLATICGLAMAMAMLVGLSPTLAPLMPLPILVPAAVVIIWRTFSSRGNQIRWMARASLRAGLLVTSLYVAVVSPTRDGDISMVYRSEVAQVVQDGAEAARMRDWLKANRLYSVKDAIRGTWNEMPAPNVTWVERRDRDSRSLGYEERPGQPKFIWQKVANVEERVAVFEAMQATSFRSRLDEAVGGEKFMRGAPILTLRFVYEAGLTAFAWQLIFLAVGLMIHLPATVFRDSFRTRRSTTRRPLS